jgi:preprotein translocase subunit SecG
MSILIVTLHIIVCVALILIVLLQTGKGADMGAAFGGGGSQTLFGSTGASTFLGKATTVAAIVFMITSLVLAYVSSNRSGGSIMKDGKVPVEQTAKTAGDSTSAQPPAKTEASGQPAKPPVKTDNSAPAKTETAAPVDTTKPSD